MKFLKLSGGRCVAIIGTLLFLAIPLQMFFGVDGARWQLGITIFAIFLLVITGRFATIFRR